MAGDWSPTTVGEVTDLVTKGTTPTTLGGRFVEQGINFVKVESLTEDGRLLPEKMAHIDAATDALLSRSRLVQDDILFTIAGTIGRTAIVPSWLLPANTNQAVAIVRPKRELIDPRFLFYALRDETRIKHAQTRVVQSVQANFSLGELSSLEIPLPPLVDQKAIAGVLRALDDKIELNRRMNETLEAMVRALFQSWFVDFDPVRAKLDSRKPEGVDEATAAFFPGSFDETALGYIPKGWKVGKIQDCCVQIQNGGTPRRNEPRFWDGGTIPWLASGEVRQSIITATESYITEEGLAESTAKWVPAFSTVVALYGATAGQVAFISTRLTTNQAVCALIPKQAFAYFNYLTMRRSTTEMENKAVGSAQQNISKGIVEETQVVLPPLALAERFTALVSPLFERWTLNLHQSRTLAALRDTPLPKLLSGELSVDKIKKGLVA